MTSAGLPPINSLIDLVFLDGEIFMSRVEDHVGRLMTVAAPYGVDVPAIGSLLEIAWVNGDRRQAVDMRLSGITKEQPPRWQLEVVGSVRLCTRRHYVRGGGGEGVELTKDDLPCASKVIDMSEGGVRCRVREDRFYHDDRVGVRLILGDEVLELDGTVRFVRRRPEMDDVDVIITYEVTEAIGRTIRGYILRREMELRRRVRESVANA